MKYVCRRCITAFSSEQVLSDHLERCIKQKPANIGFSWKDKIVFEDHHMKIQVPFRVYADFEDIIQTQNGHSKVLFKQYPIAVGYLITPLENGNKYYSYFGESCIKLFVMKY